MEENVNQTEKEMAENEKQKQAEKAVTENKNQKQAETIRGLTAQQVAERMEKGLWNKKAESATKTTKEIIKSNVFTYFNLIFLVIALLLIGVGAFRDLTFLPIIIANTLIGIVQEIRSKKVLDDLSILNSPKTRAIRDGSKKEIPADELVLDDIVELSAGGQIPADAVVLNGQLNVNESLLTGESDEIVKKSGDELLSGSFVVSGSCLARLTKVGEESYISKLTHRATQTKEGEQSEMIRSLNRLVQAVGIVIIPIGVVLFVQQFVYAGTPLRDSVTSMVAAILGMIPEGLYLLASVAMAVSAMRLAKQQVLIHDMKCIETLARVDVLCVDKTGTITENKMSVREIIPLAKEEEETSLHALIGDVVWNTGSNSWNSELSEEESEDYLNSHSHAYEFYSYERSNNIGKVCSLGDGCNDTVKRTTMWTGQIGLMYLSDYGYATSGGTSMNRASCLAKELYNWGIHSYGDCTDNDWFYNSNGWPLMPFAMYDTSSSVGGLPASFEGPVYPTVYLKANVTILNGSGSYDDPYEIGF